METIQKSNVKYWELVDENQIKINKQRGKILDELRTSFNLEYVVHSPFADLNIAALNPHIRKISLKIIEKSFYYSTLVGAKLCVFHPGFHGALSNLNPGRDHRLNLEAIMELSEFAEEYGIQIAVENMPGKMFALLSKVEDFELFFGTLGSEVGLALDVGHANTVKQLDQFLLKFGDRIVHVHAHDNDGDFDSHRGIGKGSVNWVRAIQMLKEKNFDKYIMIESLEDPYLGLKYLNELINKRSF
jgi:sugar phosphate isomerase/epimerase